MVLSPWEGRAGAGRSTPEEMNQRGSHGSRGADRFGSGGWCFDVSLAEVVMGRSARTPGLRGEVAYRVKASPRLSMSTRNVRMVLPG
jgi:hypothetical protein